MSWLIRLVIMGVLAALFITVMGTVNITIPVGVTESVVGLGGLMAKAGWFVPLVSVFQATTFVVGVYMFRGVVALFKQLAKLIGQS